MWVRRDRRFVGEKRLEMCGLEKVGDVWVRRGLRCVGEKRLEMCG